MKFSEFLQESETVRIVTKVKKILAAVDPSLRITDSFMQSTRTHRDVTVSQTVKGDSVFVYVVWDSRRQRAFDFSLIHDDDEMRRNIKQRVQKIEQSKRDKRKTFLDKFITRVFTELDAKTVSFSTDFHRYTSPATYDTVNTTRLDHASPQFAIRFAFAKQSDSYLMFKDKRREFYTQLEEMVEVVTRVTGHPIKLSYLEIYPNYHTITDQEYASMVDKDKDLANRFSNAFGKSAILIQHHMANDPAIKEQLGQIAELAKKIADRLGLSIKVQYTKPNQPEKPPYNLSLLKFTVSAQ
jgi:hypothetical protein